MWIAVGLVLGSLYVGGYLMSQNEFTPGDLMSFMVATQTIQRYMLQLFLFCLSLLSSLLSLLLSLYINGI